ncbi:MAG TPA: hypothetical protein VKS25_08760 [Solirubrobacteraceae bacterium]|nr:hypothetical protein [Solirubrobacteraceae bacterium]
MEAGADRRRARLQRLIGGGTAGNEQLTAINGVVLILLLAALGVTIVRIGALLDAHMFIGMLLLGPVALKMASTGYRFVRYYTGSATYREKGPPPDIMRAIAPLVVVSTVVVFATGVALLFVAPAQSGVLRPLHKLSFIVWVAVTALHVLGHLVDLPAGLVADRRIAYDDHGGGRGARILALAGALVGGLVLAVVLESRFSIWTAFRHHH